MHYVDAIQLVCALSILKSQGSDYLSVVMPISLNQQNMLGGKLIYAGITRVRIAVAGVSAAARRIILRSPFRILVEHRKTVSLAEDQGMPS